MKNYTRTCAILIVLIAVNFLYAINIENQEKADSLYQKAQSLMFNDNFEDALKVLEKVTSIKINDVSTYTLIGVCYLEMKEYDKAYNAYNKALKVDPNYLAARHRLEELYAFTNRPELAAKEWEKVLLLEPSTDILTRIFFYSKGLKEHEIVIEAGKTLINKSYGNSLDDLNNKMYHLGNDMYYEGMCSSYITLGKYKDAADIARNLIEEYPENTNGYYLLGKIYALSSLNSEAIKYYKKALEIDPESENSHLLLGISYFEENNFDKAKEELVQTIKINPDNVDAHRTLSSVYVKFGQYYKAIQSQQQVIRLEPENIDEFVSMANLHMLYKSYSSAQEILEIVIQDDSNNIDAHYLLGVVHLQLGNSTGALEEYKTLKGLDIYEANKLFNLIY